ncbi:MAG: SDR family NAD(P)-dependent oxidoreductase, partial [Caldilinea sp.]|nr:SDR family NAD(P)-dependent oxidoreductase [Caldilinea sp.]
MQPGELSGKVFIVTGGNTGIGAAIVQQLAQRGGHVALVSRNRDKGEAAVQAIRAAAPESAVDLVIGDLSTVAAVSDLAATLL